ncbi:MAG: nucleotide exchange factor GrpE [Candidatus Dependentiae bacterium]
MESNNNAPEMNEKAACYLENDTQNEPAEFQESASESATEQTEHNEELQAQLDACKVESHEWKNKFMLISADMQNYKRRIEKEQSMWTRRAQEDILVKLLAIVDDFDRALAEHKKQEKTPELDAWLKGFEMIGKGLYKFLGTMHVSEIEQMQAFDPMLHEAIAQVDMPDVTSGDIVDVVQKGFMFGDEVLRPAKVTVAK